MKRLFCPLCRANVVAEVYGNQRAHFYYIVCPSCGARICLEGGR
ncbi:MAG: hypothetical protein PWP32_1669 [Methanothermobacter sp.]|nr:hypothetical protein [Methanothermobacter sp.]